MILLLLAACRPDESAPSVADTAPSACDVEAIGLPTTYTPAAAVEVLTDDRGIRHVYAASDADLFWGAGYQIAADRLFQFDTWRRLARGTMAEVRGEDEVTSDLTARVFGYDRYACESLVWVAEDRPDDFALVVAYVAGLNRRVEEVRSGAAALPADFATLGYVPEPFSLEDVLAIGKRINLGYSSTVEYDLLYGLMTQLVPNAADFPIFDPGPARFIVADAAPASTARPGPRGAARGGRAPTADEVVAIRDALARIREAHGMGPGSNNWAVNGAHTENGRPLLANDPHSGYATPATLWQVHLDSASAGGAFDVVGFAFPGVPGVQLGHNRRLAWAATTAQADQTDLWAVPVDDGVAQLGGEEVPVIEEVETIRVKLDDGTVEDRAFTVRRVEGRGVFLPEELLPVPSTLFGGDLLVGWVGLQPTDEIFTFFDLDRAEDLDAFEAAVGYQKVGLHNWVGATAEGVRYRVHGWVPDRGPVGARIAANRVLDGTDASTLWTGAYLDADLLPHLDGSQDYIVTANNDPFGHTADNDPLNDDVYYASWFAPSYRAERVASELERLIAAGPVTPAQMAALQMDDHSLLADGLVPLLEGAVARIDTNEDLAEWRGREDLVAAAARLSAWDRGMGRDSAEAALFRAWEGFLEKRTLSDLSFLFDAVEDSASVTVANVNLLVHQGQVESVLGGNADVHLVAALDEALAWTAERAAERGVAEVVWGDVHRARFDADVGDDVYVPMDGDDATVNVGQCSFWDGDDPAALCDTPDGAIFRTVTTFADDGTPTSSFAVPYGADGDVDRWLAGDLDALPFARADVEARTVERTTLSP